MRPWEEERQLDRRRAIRPPSKEGDTEFYSPLLAPANEGP